MSWLDEHFWDSVDVGQTVPIVSWRQIVWFELAVIITTTSGCGSFLLLATQNPQRKFVVAAISNEEGGRRVTFRVSAVSELEKFLFAHG